MTLTYRLAFLSILTGLILLSGGCNGLPDGEVSIILPDPVERDLDAIRAGDTLVVLTQFNSTSYFLYRGEPMGYEYDFLRWFARENDLHLKPLVVRNRDSLLVLLNQGVGDVVAARMAPTPTDSAHVAFTDPLYRTRPVVVQREAPLEQAEVPESVETYIDSLDDAYEGPGFRAEPLTVRARLVTRPQELSGQEVHVLDDTRMEDRLIELSDALQGDIYVVEVDSGTIEMLMQDVAQERISYTIGHENVARLQESYYTNLVVLPVIDRPYEVAWAVRKNAPMLWEALNEWIDANPGLEDRLFARYFVDRQGYRERVADEYLTSETGKLSPFDDLFREHAPRLDWDWRLLASQTFQESRFKPQARSWAGAMGLLQLMPGTARQVGVADPYDPDENVRGAVDYLEWLFETYWNERITDPQERLKFVLASYNAGAGHVQDAQRLTEKYGGDPTLWKDVAYWLLRKSEREVYTDPIVRHGFCRGLEPVTYVSRILDRYDHYQQFVDAVASEAAAVDEASEASP